MFDYSMLSPNQIEVFPLAVDTSKLRSQFETEILPLPPVVRSAAISGWAIQSQDGDYTHGLETNFLPNNGPDNFGPTWTPRNQCEISLLTMQDFNVPTSLCKGYIREIMSRIQELGFHPRRARILKLGPGARSSWHVDGQPSAYSVRLHIPIITNRDCFFSYENESFHMAADGNAFIIKVNRKHMIHNSSVQDRFHLVMNIWDRLGRTRFHGYSP